MVIVSQMIMMTMLMKTKNKKFWLNNSKKMLPRKGNRKICGLLSKGILEYYHQNLQRCMI